MKKLSLKTFQRYLNSADSTITCGNEVILLLKNGKERKFPKSYLKEHVEEIKKKYKTN